uniref:Pectinesterase inhibitor domain-containing protein n=1 Tax=Fagus sylvatica TaxID=28930 RepID=A0A2N9F0M9_FAGSY
MSLTLGSLFGLLVHEYTTEPPESPSSNSADSIIIKAVCNVTRYPDSCFSTITSLSSSSSPKPTDPEAIFKLSIRVSIAELSNFKTIISNSNEVGAMVDCQSQIEDALSRLNDSVVAMEVGTGEKVLTESKISAVFSPDNLGRRSGSQSCLVLSFSPSLMALPWPPRLVLSLSPSLMALPWPPGKRERS